MGVGDDIDEDSISDGASDILRYIRVSEEPGFNLSYLQIESWVTRDDGKVKTFLSDTRCSSSSSSWSVVNTCR